MCYRLNNAPVSAFVVFLQTMEWVFTLAATQTAIRNPRGGGRGVSGAKP